MHEQDMDISLKVIIVGNGMVGKTSLINRFARGVTTETYKKTIGTDFMEKEITVRNTGDIVKLMLWDTAGQEMFSKLTRSYYKGSGAVIYVFSTVDRESFLEVEKWKQKVESECGDIASVLVQNKIDLLEKAQMTQPEVEELARKMNVRLFRTSVKEGLFVEDIFDYLAELYLTQADAPSEAVPSISAPPLAMTTVEAEAEAAKKAAAASSSIPSYASTTSTSTSSSNAKQGGGGFQLAPMTQRTKGKKTSWCNIL